MGFTIERIDRSVSWTDIVKGDSVCPLCYPGFLLSVFCVVLFTRATFYILLLCVIFVFCLFLILVRLSVPVQVKWRLISEINVKNLAV